jgi:hypothetical protein
MTEQQKSEYEIGQELALFGPGINPYRAALSPYYWQGYIDAFRAIERDPLIAVEAINLKRMGETLVVPSTASQILEATREERL